MAGIQIDPKKQRCQPLRRLALLHQTTVSLRFVHNPASLCRSRSEHISGTSGSTTLFPGATIVPSGSGRQRCPTSKPPHCYSREKEPASIRKCFLLP